MPRDLFGDVTRPSISIGNRKWYTVPLSLLSHVTIVAAVVVVPLLATDVLPAPTYESIDVFFDPVPPPPPPPPPLERNERMKIDTVEPGISVDAPTGINPEPPQPIESGGPDISEHIVRGSGDVSALIAPPPPLERRDPVLVGGAIRQPQKIREVAPVYPPIAQAARVQGIVIIEATIGEDGRVVNARVLRSVPLLDQAALDAVRQWQYTPTLLNGVPVPVIMTVTVQFTLSR